MLKCTVRCLRSAILVTFLLFSWTTPRWFFMLLKFVPPPRETSNACSLFFLFRFQVYNSLRYDKNNLTIRKRKPSCLKMISNQKFCAFNPGWLKYVDLSVFFCAWISCGRFLSNFNQLFKKCGILSFGMYSVLS